ncbi:MAG: Nif3-like dinuclear metal center hexameric protein [Bacteroidia bacterium]
MELLKNITSYLETIAPLRYQESYDNAGLITGNHEMQITGAMIALDSTEAVIDEAIEKRCNLVIAHHPIVFSGLKKINGKNYVERTIIKAIKNDIAIYGIHTNLDNVHNGVNAKICEVLGLMNCKILSPKNGLLKKLVTFVPIADAEKVSKALFDAGSGRIGNYDECSFNVDGNGTFRASENANPVKGEKGILHNELETRIETIFESVHQHAIIKALLSVHSYEEVAYDIYPLDNSYQNVGSGMVGEFEKEMSETDFLQLLKTKMLTGCVRHTSLLNKKVKRVALCGGAGSFLLNEAIASGAQAFVTADYKYHQFFDADGKILIADIGHYESEQFTKQLLYDLLNRNFNTFALRLTTVNTNPINYFS